MLRTESLQEGLLVDQRSTGDVAENRPGLHGADPFPIEQSLGVRPGRGRNDHGVAAADHFVQLTGGEQLVHVRIGVTRRGAAAIGQNPHIEGACPSGGGPSDGAQAHDADGATGDTTPEDRLPVALGLPLFEGPEVLPDLKEPTDHKLGDGDGRDAGPTGEDHAAFGQAISVEVIGPGGDGLDPLQRAGPLQHGVG